MPSPDENLVYHHCSSIFVGKNAEIRKLKAVRQRLSDHKTSIQALTRNFSVPDIATVAKRLLEEGVFQSVPQAKRRFPELFQQPEAEEAKSKASKANVPRLEVEEAHEAVLTSEEETDSDYDGTSAYLRRLPSNDFGGVNASLHSQPNPTTNLHSFYLPFKTQHQILTVVQTILEECCFDFGRTWLPLLMKAHSWHEVESIELTQWVKAFCKYTGDLPSSATRSIAGKSLKRVLYDTSSLRHAAVHRLPTTAADLVSMLRAAHSFTTALNDPLRTSEIERIRINVSLAVSYFSADGPRCNSWLSSYDDQMDKFQCQISAQNHKGAADWSNAKHESVYEDRLNLFPVAKDEDGLDVKNTPQTTDNYLPSDASEPGIQESSEASDWLSFLGAAPISEEACKRIAAHTAEILVAGDTRAGYNAVPATSFTSQSAISTRASPVPYSIMSADIKAPQDETHISMPSIGSLIDTDMLAPMISLVSNTRAAILDHARAVYEWCVAEDEE